MEIKKSDDIITYSVSLTKEDRTQLFNELRELNKALSQPGQHVPKIWDLLTRITEYSGTR